MIKKIVFVLFFLLFYIIPSPIEAIFARYSDNPILKPEQAYEINGLYAPSVVYKNNQYYLWYSSLQAGTWTISLATSTDGYSWTKYVQNPVIVPDTSNTTICEKGAHDPDVLWNQNLNKFQIWYIVNCESQPTGVPRYWVKYGESTDGISWLIQQSPVLSPSLAWEQEGISFPTVILDSPLYKMWYSGRDSVGNWKIGYAISNDGKNWTKHPQNPLISPTQPWEVSHIGGSDVIKENSLYTMYYHGAPVWPPVNLIYATSTDGINWQKPNDNPTITTNQTENKISTPDIIKDNQGYKIYYSAIINGVWQISLLTDNLSSPTPTLTPTPTPKNPIIILPGFFGSWNKEAILHNQTSNPSQWKLNPAVKDYDGIINTLNNLGYVENQDFFVFAYDWRKSLNNLADDLNKYIQQLAINNQQLNLVGHSLGGLVARIYAQKHGTDRINKLLTVGSPHQGTANAYKPVEAGEIDRQDNLFWLAEKMILVLNKDSFETDKETIQTILPVAKDLLPTYNFLKNQNNQEIQIQNMIIKNDLLLSYKTNLPNIFPIFHTFACEKGPTLFGLKVKPRTILDQLLDLYPDGRPVENYYQNGDFVITLNSAQAGDNPAILNLDHGELVYKSLGIKKILDELDISYQDNQIVEGAQTQIFPSLIFLIKSPAEMEVKFNGEIFYEQDGMIFIENAPSGNYTLKVKGKEKGRYTVIVGQITGQNDLWDTIEGEIGKTPPTSQIDTYSFFFNPLSPPYPSFPPLTLFDELLLYLTDLNKTVKKTEISKAIDNLNQAKQYYQQNNKGRLKSALQLAHQQLFLARTKVNNSNKKKILYAIEKLENLYEKSLGNYVFGVYASRLKSDLANYKRLIDPTQKYLLAKKQKGKNVVKNANILIEIENRLNSAEENLNKNNLNLVEILLKSIEQLTKEVRRL